MKHSRVAYSRRTAFRDRQEASTHGKPMSENFPVKDQTNADYVSTTGHAKSSALRERKTLFPQQHQKRPGLESELEPKPRPAPRGGCSVQGGGKAAREDRIGHRRRLGHLTPSASIAILVSSGGRDHRRVKLRLG